MLQIKMQMQNDMRGNFFFVTIFVLELFSTPFEQRLKEKNSFGCIAELAGL